MHTFLVVLVTGGHQKVGKKNKIIFMGWHFCHSRGIDREPQQCPPLGMGSTLAAPVNLQGIKTCISPTTPTTPVCIHDFITEFQVCD